MKRMLDSVKSIVRTIYLLFGVLIYNNKRSKIIYYHDVHELCQYSDMSTSMNLFINHISAIRRLGFTIVPSINNDFNQIQIAFDDGLLGIWDNREFFYKENIRPVVFLAVNLIGNDGYLDTDQILELQDNGFNFQCHTCSHKNLTTFIGKDLDSELIDSKEYLEILLNKRIDQICFPQGYFTDEIILKCKMFGYKYIHTSIPGCYQQENLSIVYRNLAQSLNVFQLRLVLRGANDVFRNRIIKLHKRDV